MLSNDVAELIVDLNLRSLALEKKNKELESKSAAALLELKRYEGYMDEIGVLIGYSGHPANMVGIVRDRLKEGAVHEG